MSSLLFCLGPLGDEEESWGFHHATAALFIQALSEIQLVVFNLIAFFFFWI